MRKFLFRLSLSLLVTCVLVAAIEGAASLWLKWSESGLPPAVREASHCEYDPELGWRHVANKQVRDLYGAGLHLRTNGQHMRGESDHALADTAGKYRILCLGDSFTMGYGVADDETYPVCLAQQHPTIETLNMGLGGYGLDQCWLWYLRDGVKFDVDLLLFTFIVGDFFRMNPNGNVADIPKPILELVNGDPVAINVPVTNILVPGFGMRLSRMWQASSLASLLPRTLAAPSIAPSEAPQQRFAPIALRMFEILRDRSQQRGQRFVMALLPVMEEVWLDRIELIDGWLQPALAERGIPFLDLRPAFRQVAKSELSDHFTQGHYSKRGNLVAARALFDGLLTVDPECPR
jgi:hypothetical protein